MFDAKAETSALEQYLALAAARGPRVDPINLRILHILERDARTPIARIARQVGLTENAVRYRVRRLRSLGVVRRVTVHVDPARLGHATQAVVLLRLSNGTLPSFGGGPSVALSVPTTGPYQAVLLVLARDRGELEGFLQGLRGAPEVLECVALEVGAGAELPVLPSACLRGLLGLS